MSAINAKVNEFEYGAIYMRCADESCDMRNSRKRTSSAGKPVQNYVVMADNDKVAKMITIANRILLIQSPFEIEAISFFYLRCT